MYEPFSYWMSQWLMAPEFTEHCICDSTGREPGPVYHTHWISWLLMTWHLSEDSFMGNAQDIYSLWVWKWLISITAHLPEARGLTLNVRGLSYLGLTRSISWLLMLWLLSLPGHQQPWYWLCRIDRSLSYLRKDFNYLCLIDVEEWHKM